LTRLLIVVSLYEWLLISERLYARRWGQT